MRMQWQVVEKPNEQRVNKQAHGGRRTIEMMIGRGGMRCVTTQVPGL